ncbi:MAG: hypothetical protein Kow0098_11180 [Ignavibacteriaceae bacterium]
MTILLTQFAFMVILLISKKLFNRWMNPLSIYAGVWSLLITFYEFKLFQYEDIRLFTWVIILLAFCSFLIGILTFFTAKQVFSTNLTQSKTNPKEIIPFRKQHANIILLIALVFSTIGLFAALIHWLVLIKMFGSVTEVFVYANIVYQMRVQGEIEGVIPYLSSFNFASVFLAAIYTAYKGKVTWISVYSFLVLSMQELANVGRAGLLFGLIIFFSTFFFLRNKFKQNSESEYKVKKARTILTTLVFIIIFVFVATFVKQVRGTVESFKGATRSLSSLETSEFITPSIYLYSSVHIGVLNKFLELDKEDTKIGQNIFLPVYSILAKFGVTDKPSIYQKGYYVPMWANTGTYLREIYADFGITGIILIPYFLGLFCSHFWESFYRNNNFISLTLLVYLCSVLFISFLMMITRLGSWYISLLILLITFTILEKSVFKRSVQP